MLKIHGGALALALLLVAPAAASPRDVLDDFGFFGEWAVDCAQPASVDNPHRDAYLNERREPVFTETLDPEAQGNTYAIVAARAGKSSLRIKVRLNETVTQSLRLVRRGERIRTVTNRSLPDGRLLVKNGIVVSIGAPTPWLTRCGDPRK